MDGWNVLAFKEKSMTLENLFFETESPTPTLDRLRQMGRAPRTGLGMAQLLEPSGKPGPVVTAWYALLWCKDHRDWSWCRL